MGLFLGTGDQDNYVKVVTFANGGAGGVQARKEVGGVAATPSSSNLTLPGPTGSTSTSPSTSPRPRCSRATPSSTTASAAR